MTTPLACLLFFAAWTLGIVLIGIGPFRVLQVMLHKASPGSFPAYTPHGPEWYQRVMRAHANCVENLPVFGTVVLVGHLCGQSSGTFATLSQVYVVARVGQTLAHISSGRGRVINIRFAFFLIQVITAFCMMGLILKG